MKNGKILFLSLLSIFLLSGNNVLANAASNNMQGAEQSYLEEVSDVEGYYNNSSIKGKKGDELLESLASLLTETHRTYTSYDDLRGALAYSDEDESDPTKIRAFYGGVPISSYWDPNNNSNVEGWNREHVWCKSLSGGLFSSVNGSSKHAGSDIHQIMPSLNGINSSRGNKPYADLSKQGTEVIYKHTSMDVPTGNYYNEKYFEPRDDIKGDVARILMYVYTHYSSEVDNSTPEKKGLLKMSEIVYGGEETSLELLLRWNKFDPISNFEIKRNNYCHSVTGARNPFIDHPEFASMIWGNYNGTGALIDNSYENEIIDIESINLSKKTLTINEGEKSQLFTFFTPSYSTSKKITYSSSNTNVATVNGGLVEGIKEGSATITVTSENGKTSTCVVEVKKVNINQDSINTWNLVKDINDIKDGSKVIIAAFASDFAISTNQKSNNRAAIAITKEGEAIKTIEGTEGETADEFLVSKTDGYLTFTSKAKNGYLYAAGGGNYLRTGATLNDKAKWDVTIGSNGIATIKALDTGVTQNLMRFNKTSSLFACYKSGQQDIALYVLEEKVEPTPNPGGDTTTTVPPTTEEPPLTTEPPVSSNITVPPTTSNTTSTSSTSSNNGCSKANFNLLFAFSFIGLILIISYKKKD